MYYLLFQSSLLVCKSLCRCRQVISDIELVLPLAFTLFAVFFFLAWLAGLHFVVMTASIHGIGSFRTRCSKEVAIELNYTVHVKITPK